MEKISWLLLSAIPQVSPHIPSRYLSNMMLELKISICHQLVRLFVQFISSYPNTPVHIIYILKKNIYSWCVWTNFARCRTKPATMDARRLLWCSGPQRVQSGMPQLETIGNLSDFGQTMQDPTFEAPLQLALRSHYPVIFLSSGRFKHASEAMESAEEELLELLTCHRSATYPNWSNLKIPKYIMYIISSWHNTS